MISIENPRYEDLTFVTTNKRLPDLEAAAIKTDVEIEIVTIIPGKNNDSAQIHFQLGDKQQPKFWKEVVKRRRRNLNRI